MSANTAAIVDHATAKETRNRYQSIEQMLVDLEGALALEATRAGQTSGEATTVLRALPEDRRSWVPWRVRFPRRAAALTLLAAAVAAVVVVVIVSRTHESTPPTAPPTQPKGTPAPVAVQLAPDAASDFDPLGDQAEHHTDVGNAIDHNALTAWTTETYDSGIPQTKAGVGLYVDTRNPLVAQRLDIISRDSGYQARVLAAAGDTPPPKVDDWTPVSDPVTVGSVTHIPIDTQGKSYRFYLVWITRIDAGRSAGINELTLNR